jgi:CO/xanthine dehydrogenase Mo-binding subunit
MIQAVETAKTPTWFIDVIGDKSKEHGSRLLSSVVWDMVPVYTAMVEDLKADTFGTHGYSIGLKDDSVQLLKTKHIPEDVWNEVMALRQQIVETAADALEANVNDLDMQDGRVFVKGSPERGLTLRELYTRSATQKGGPPLASFSSRNLPPSVNYAIQVAEVEVDPDTGEVKVLNLTALQDVGFALNPLAVEGQIQGGVVQGLGYALSEEMKFDSTGRLMNPHLLDYKLPSIMDVPKVKPVLIEEPITSPQTPYGAKGVGEPPIVPMAAAVANAIYDAIGVRVTSLPLTPEKVLKAIREQQR